MEQLQKLDSDINILTQDQAQFVLKALLVSGYVSEHVMQKEN